MQQVRMDRSNTYIKVSGTVGWACYQWDLRSSCGRPTYGIPKARPRWFLEKRNNHWVIVLNHTSLASEGPADRSRKRTFTPAATCKAGTALKLAGKLGRAEDLEEALSPSLSHIPAITSSNAPARMPVSHDGRESAFDSWPQSPVALWPYVLEPHRERFDRLRGSRGGSAEATEPGNTAGNDSPGDQQVKQWPR